MAKKAAKESKIAPRSFRRYLLSLGPWQVFPPNSLNPAMWYSTIQQSLKTARTHQRDIALDCADQKRLKQMMNGEYMRERVWRPPNDPAVNLMKCIKALEETSSLPKHLKEYEMQPIFPIF